MLDAARKAVQFATGRNRNDLDTDEMLALASTRLVEIIGEAAKAIPEEFRSAHPSIPWRSIAGARDKLVHGYFDVDLDVMWQILSESLPPLIAELEKITPAP